ncbi:hypothetical protein R3P38DRAFT_2775197 [Favolaschia claudopus]|uniref:Uncharacterized protein n=1 Tax=Favolaschia claudopus TaxID=2862362 RepID=A0AAW0BW95_9AGAR
MAGRDKGGSGDGLPRRGAWLAMRGRDRERAGRTLIRTYRRQRRLRERRRRRGEESVGGAGGRTSAGPKFQWKLNRHPRYSSPMESSTLTRCMQDEQGNRETTNRSAVAKFPYKLLFTLTQQLFRCLNDLKKIAGKTEERASTGPLDVFLEHKQQSEAEWRRVAKIRKRGARAARLMNAFLKSSGYEEIVNRLLVQYSQKPTQSRTQGYQARDEGSSRRDGRNDVSGNPFRFEAPCDGDSKVRGCKIQRGRDKIEVVFASSSCFSNLAGTIKRYPSADSVAEGNLAINALVDNEMLMLPESEKRRETPRNEVGRPHSDTPSNKIVHLPRYRTNSALSTWGNDESSARKKDSEKSRRRFVKRYRPGVHQGEGEWRTPHAEIVWWR